MGSYRKDHTTYEKCSKEIKDSLLFLKYAPVVLYLQKRGKINKIMEMIDNISEQYSIRVKTGVLNRIITDATDAVEPPIFKGRRLKIYYATQSSTKPPFSLFC